MDCSICLGPLTQAGTLDCGEGHKVDYKCVKELFKLWREDSLKRGPCPECRGEVTLWTYDSQFSQKKNLCFKGSYWINSSAKHEICLDNGDSFNNMSLSSIESIFVHS